MPISKAICPIRILCAVQGDGGGIGRVDCLLDQSWELLEDRAWLQAYTIRKHAQSVLLPSRREGRSWTAKGNKGRFARMVIQHWATARPDVVLLGHLNFLPMALLMQSLRPRAAVVTMVHGIEAWGRLSPMKSFILRRNRVVWSVSSYTAHRVIENSGISADRIRLLPNALSPELFAGLAPSGHSASKEPGTSLLSVSRLDRSERAKGIDYVLAALPTIAARIPDVSYTVIGGGPDLQRLREIATQLGVDGRVKFLGNVDDRTLVNAYRACDLFVLPSAKEGFGLVFLEAMAAGKPVVAARVGGATEVVEDNESGILVEYGNVAELSHVITNLLMDDHTRRRLGRAGRRSVQSRFTLESYVDRLGSLIAEVAERPLLPRSQCPA